MSEHPHVRLIRDGYAAFAKGDLAALNQVFDEELVWHEPGRNELAGDYRGRDAVYAHFGRLADVFDGPLQMEIQAVFADDEHGVALVSTTVTRGGRILMAYGAQIFRLRGGKVVEFWGAPSDPYAFDEFMTQDAIVKGAV